MKFLERIITNAKSCPRRIVFAEGTEPRILRATEIILKENIARIILLGDPVEIMASAESCGVNINGTVLVNPLTDSRRKQYLEQLTGNDQQEAIAEQEASELLDNPLFFAVMMVKRGDADGEVAGVINPANEVLRPAFRIIGPMSQTNVVSGAFFMALNDPHFGHDGILVFSDCVVTPDPNAEELAEIAVTTARTAMTFLETEPRVAMLSFSTLGSVSHPNAEKVAKAVQLARQLDPALQIDGEMQLDVALMPDVARIQMPESDVAGRANVLVFPCLESANIGYSLVQRLAGAEAIGPVLQGMNAPVNVLSGGCSVIDIVNMAAVTASQVQLK